MSPGIFEGIRYPFDLASRSCGLRTDFGLIDFLEKESKLISRRARLNQEAPIGRELAFHHFFFLPFFRSFDPLVTGDYGRVRGCILSALTHTHTHTDRYMQTRQEQKLDLING